MNEWEDGEMAGRGPKPRNAGGLQRGKETDSLLNPPKGGSLANTLTSILVSWTP